MELVNSIIPALVDPVATMLHCTGALAVCHRRSEISGNASGQFSGASDRSWQSVLAVPIVLLAISSKMNGMRAIDCAFRGLAQMLLKYLQKEQQLQNNMRGRSDASQYSIHHLERQAISPV